MVTCAHLQSTTTLSVNRFEPAAVAIRNPIDLPLFAVPSRDTEEMRTFGQNHSIRIKHAKRYVVCRVTISPSIAGFYRKEQANVIFTPILRTEVPPHRPESPPDAHCFKLIKPPSRPTRCRRFAYNSPSASNAPPVAPTPP